MAGRGPAPKPASRRVRSDAGAIPLRVIVADPVSQPELPDIQIEQDGELVDFRWPQATLDWWRMWAEEPVSAEFRATDWAFLADTALLHAAVWRGELKYAAELRLRVAKMAATMEDRARLRITFAAADEADERLKRPSSGARDRYKGLRAAGA